MNRMGMTFRKGKKRSRVSLVALLLAVVLAAAGLVTASAAASGKFDIFVGGVEKIGKQDGAVAVSTEEEINFQRIFSADEGHWEWNGWWSHHVPGITTLTNIRAMVMHADTGGPGKSIRIEVPDWEKKRTQWEVVYNRDGSTDITYKKQSGTITAEEMNAAMAKIEVYFDENSTAKSAQTKISIKTYNSYNGREEKNIIAQPFKTHTCELTFYSYTQGRVDENSTDMDYKASYAQNYNTTYEQDVPEGEAATDVYVTPNDSKGGKATFDLYISEKSASGTAGTSKYGYEAWIGYQIKTDNETWASKEIQYLKDSKGNKKVIKLATWNTNTAIPVTVEGLNADTTYNIRGVVITDGKTGAPQTTQELTFRYNRPSISNFNAGGANKIYKGGVDTVNLSMLTTFNDQNYKNAKGYMADGQWHPGYTDVYGDKRNGPVLKAQVYITTDFNREETKNEDGTVTYGRDLSKWYKVDRLTETKDLMDAKGNVATSFASTPEKWSLYTLPKTMGEIMGTANTDPINSTKCAFKLVVTDLYTGYSTYTYSDPFTIDSSAPTDVRIVGQSQENPNDPIELDINANRVVGGAGAKIRVNIGNANDHNGSGVKEYDYAIYTLSTADAQSFENRAAVFAEMAKYTPESHGKATYTPWAAAPDRIKDDGTVHENWSEVTVSKDGYYRIDAKAVDNAGYETEEVVQAYFQVDLTLPTTPEVRLVQRKQSALDKEITAENAYDNLEPYDNRTYSDQKVWLFARSNPKAGKTIKYFEYSTDGGLTWKKFSAAKNKILEYSQGEDGTYKYKVSAYEGNYNSGVDFRYQAGIDLTAEGLDDYNSIVVRVTDNLGNQSLASKAVEMRTIGQTPQPTSVLNHEGIEVALALGNTEMETSTLTEDLKSRAAYYINEKYYGTSGQGTDPNGANFNPWLYVKSLRHTPDSNTREGWRCTWGDDASCAGACHDGANCPYAKVAKLGYTIYKPEIVNIQGISGADATDQSKFPWVRYDHSMYNTISDGNGGTVQVATAAISQKSPLKSTVAHNPSSYYTSPSGEKFYTATEDRVIYTGQMNVVSDVRGTVSTEANGANWWAVTTNKQGPNSAYGPTMGGTYGVYAWDSRFADTWKNAGQWGLAPSGASSKSTTARRVYHLVDMSQGGDLSKTGDMSTIRAFGYTWSSFRDWLFLYNDQPTKKEIAFTVADGQLFAHSTDGYGFLFNTTIRENEDHEWVISGYLFYLGNFCIADNNEHDYHWKILKLTDLNLDWFADGLTIGEGTGTGGNTSAGSGSNARSHANADLNCYLVGGKWSNGVITPGHGGKWVSSQGNGSIETVAWSDADTSADAYRHFRLVTEGNKTRLYVYTTASNVSRDALNTKYQNDMKNATYKDTPVYLNQGSTLNDSQVKSNYRLIGWKTAEGGTNLGGIVKTPRPTVDGYTIGKLAAKRAGIHGDTNCYGFGPLIANRYSNHECTRDSMVEFTNISLKMNIARSLSEVVNEPQWGGGKAKFITNISDDSTDDFQDPVLSAQIQWRLFTDEAKFIGWGACTNRETTKEFINRIEGDGKYEDSNEPAVANPDPENEDDYRQRDYDTQIDEVAEYITRQYYTAFGFNPDSTKPIQEQAADKVVGRGTVYSLEDAKSLDFSVTPEKYETSSANPDFPQGRWYIVHDVNGYESAQLSARNGRYSDALDLKITEPGRYTVYFAPDAKKVANGTLNCTDETCIFDFIVNQPPVAQFSGKVEGDGTSAKPYTVKIINSAYDPDCKTTTPNASDYTYTVNGVENTYPDQQLNGIVKTEWRWELLEKHQNPDTLEDALYVVAKGDWSEESPDGKTLAKLTEGKVTPAGKDIYGSSKNYFSTLQNSAVLTVYQKVTDVAAHREYQDDGTFKYVQKAGVTSPVNQQNLTSAGEVTYAPLSAFSLSVLNIYETADANGPTGKVTVERLSTQTQSKTEYECDWAIDLGETYGYKHLVKVNAGDGKYDYYLLPDSSYPKVTEAEKNEGKTNDSKQYETAALTQVYSVSTLPAGSTLVMKCVEKEDVAASAQASGKWEISKEFITTKVPANKSMALRITETIQGLTQADQVSGITTPHAIRDSSARAIYYRLDDNPPTAPAVEIKTWDKAKQMDAIAQGQSYSGEEYQASNYLDVSGGKKFIRISFGGSVDSEGKVSGYAYYFYDRNAQGVSGSEAAYYKYNSATKKLEPAANMRAAVVMAPSAGFVDIDMNYMRTVPTDSLNVAVFAYDNKYEGKAESTWPASNCTPGNETKKTRIENIKLSTSKPMPPEIKVTNDMNVSVAYIGNDYGYEKLDETKDKQTSDLNFFSNTAVTVHFEPRKARYTADATGDLKLDESGGGAEYYQDIYARADLTGVAEVKYSVLYRADSTANFQEMDAQDNMPSAETISFSKDGIYRITAQIVNGAGTLSSARTVEFTIDRTPPDGDPNDSDPQTPLRVTFSNDQNGQPYSSGSWAKSVTMRVETAADTNAPGARFYYTDDGGKNWHYFGRNDTDPTDEGTGKNMSISSAQTQKFTKTGEYNVRVKAVDPAGNETYNSSFPVSVKIDADGPITPGPTLTATSVSVPVYSMYLLNLNYNGENGSVYTVQNNTRNDKDTVVAVPMGGDVSVYFHPNDGMKIGTVSYQGQNYTQDSLTYDSDYGDYCLRIDNVTQDATVSVTFLDEAANTVSYMARSRSAAFSMMRPAGAAVLSAEAPAETAETVDETGGEAGEGGETGGTEEGGETPDPVRTYEVTSSWGQNGSVQLNGSEADSVTVNEGETVEVTLVPNRNCKVNWVRINGEPTSVGGESSIFKLNADGVSYTAKLVITKDTSISVDFAKIPTRILTLTSSDCGTAKLVEAENVQGGTDGQYVVQQDSKITFQLTPETGYCVKRLVINGKEQEAVVDAVGDPNVFYDYTVPAYLEEGEDPGLTAEVEFGVLSSSAKYQIEVSVDETTPFGTISHAGETVDVPVDGSRTFVITPNPGYRISKVVVGQENQDGDIIDVDVPEADLKKQLDGTTTYKLTPSSNGRIMVTFEESTYYLSTEIKQGKGSVDITRKEGGNVNLNMIPEGTSLRLETRPEDGYRIQDMKIVMGSQEYNTGAVSSYILENVSNNVNVYIYFEKRTIDGSQTTHMISAVANNVKDANDALDDEPYRFRISTADGKHMSDWSEWDKNNFISYTGSFVDWKTGETVELEPNRQYKVYVQTRDRVGNLSGETESGSSVYTRANGPSSNGAEAVDTQNEFSKSVALNINANGNPIDTEYLVYYSESSTMANMQIANESDEGGGWAQLKNGQFLIRGLSANKRYYLQVVARNKDGYATDLNNNDITSIILSPGSPPANSFYFEEQSSPMGGVTLHWTDPASDVSAFIIYRNDVPIARLDKQAREYTDLPEQQTSGVFLGDSIYVYSYAYENDAGAGSSRTAVSKEYYDAQDGADKGDDAATKKLTAMNGLAEKDDDLFSELLTYPRFPTGLTYSASEKVSSGGIADNYSGTLTVRMNYNPSVTSRYQKYYLTLKAFKIEEGKDPEDVTDKKDWAKDPSLYYNGDQQIAQATKVTNSNGATATWTGLKTEYEYKVFVERIESNGAISGSDGYGGQSPNQGIEGMLGKTCYVTPNGYGFTYKNTTAAENASLIVPEMQEWPEGEQEKYTAGYEHGWDESINKGYIAFNKSPNIALAENPYEGNDSAKLREIDGKQCILLDNSMADKTFTIQVNAWDQDGSSKNATAQPTYIAGTIKASDDIKNDPEIILSAGQEMPQTSEEAKTKPYTLTFSGDGLETGIYTDIVLEASDGDTVTPVSLTGDNGIVLVVNNTTPEASVDGGESRQVEVNKEFTSEDLPVIATVPEASDADSQKQQNQIALLVMPEQFEEAFGSSDYAELKAMLCNGTGANAANALTAAKQLLGEDANDSKYVDSATQRLTEAGLEKALAKVAPPVTTYVQINESTYNQLVGDASTKNLVFSETNAYNGDVYYWVETEYALNNSLCAWLTKSSDTVKITGTVGKTYSMKVVARFGGNVRTPTVTFEVKNAPSVTIISEQVIGWVKTIEDEYKDYKGKTVEQVKADAKDLLGEERYGKVKIEEADDAAEACETREGVNENGDPITTYWVYKLYDKQADVTKNWISGGVRMEFGMNQRFDEVRVIFTTDPNFVPHSLDDAKDLPQVQITNSIGGGQFINNGGGPREYTFTQENLVEDTPYYLWTYFKINGDPASGKETVETFSMDYVVLTTAKNYPIVYYGFELSGSSYAEKDYQNNPQTVNMNVTVNNSEGIEDAKARVTAEYYKANEFGVLERDENNEPIPLSEEELAIAKQVLKFQNGLDYMDISADQASCIVPMTLTYNAGKQGHMIVQLRLTPLDNYGKLRNGQGTTDIFIEDAQSPISTFLLDLYDPESKLSKVPNKQDPTKTDYYQYDFPGLKIGYTSTEGNGLTLSFYNNGTGNLTNIKAEVFSDQSCEERSSLFEISGLTGTSLTPITEGGPSSIPGTVTIKPARHLPDGVHEAYVCLRADHMNPSDYIKVRVVQVVGQSTLEGRIYITPTMPSDAEKTGKSTVYLYDADETNFLQDSDVFTQKWVYKAETDEYGFYTIPNIVNSKKYSIVVERDGFVRYNSMRGGQKLVQIDPARKTQTYHFDLRLLGGDVNKDQKVNDVDKAVLTENYNKYWTDETLTEEQKETIRRCDFNQDGVVNALDRAFLMYNLPSDVNSYRDYYVALSPVTEETK